MDERDDDSHEDFLRHAAPAEVDRLVTLHRRGLIDFGGMYCHWTPLATTEILAQSLMVAGPTTS